MTQIKLTNRLVISHAKNTFLQTQRGSIHLGGHLVALSLPDTFAKLAAKPRILLRTLSNNFLKLTGLYQLQDRDKLIGMSLQLLPRLLCLHDLVNFGRSQSLHYDLNPSLNSLLWNTMLSKQRTQVTR